MHANVNANVNLSLLFGLLSIVMRRNILDEARTLTFFYIYKSLNTMSFLIHNDTLRRRVSLPQAAWRREEKVRRKFKGFANPNRVITIR